MDTLRNWEMNGLLTVKRKENGYRVYTDEDIKRLKIIRSLRCAKYSLEAILRMLRQLSKNPDIDIKAALNTPRQSEDIISVCDQLIISLTAAYPSAGADKSLWSTPSGRSCESISKSRYCVRPAGGKWSRKKHND